MTKLEPLGSTKSLVSYSPPATVTAPTRERALQVATSNDPQTKKKDGPRQYVRPKILKNFVKYGGIQVKVMSSKPRMATCSAFTDCPMLRMKGPFTQALVRKNPLYICTMVSSHVVHSKELIEYDVVTRFAHELW
jgi:hypothetical protein